MKMISSFTHPSFVQTCMSFYSVGHKYILKNVGNKQLMVAIDFHSIEKKWKSMNIVNCFVTNFL